MFIDSFGYAVISTATTTTVKISPGVLHGITINSAGSTITIYDALTATGTPIAVIASTLTGYFEYHVKFLIGLTIVTSSTGNLTVSYQ